MNVERDLKAAGDIQRKTGRTGVPVIKSGGRWIVSFAQSAIERELSRS